MRSSYRNPRWVGTLLQSPSTDHKIKFIMRKVTQRSVEKNLTKSPLISIQEYKIDLHMFWSIPVNNDEGFNLPRTFSSFLCALGHKAHRRKLWRKRNSSSPFALKMSRHDTLSFVPQRGCKSIVGSRMISKHSSVRDAWTDGRVLEGMIVS